MSKIGDIYQINSLSPKRLFQLVAFDTTQLTSDVIAVFTFNKDIPDIPTIKDVENITKSNVEFFTHTMVNIGVRQKLWTRVGKADPADTKPALFKVIYEESGFVPYQPFEMDHYDSWVIWGVGQEWRNIGPDIHKYPKAELGSVFPPEDIIYRIEHGEYPGPAYYGQKK